MSTSAIRSYVSGLMGSGLILAQALSASAIEWMLLGALALMAGGAGHAWVTARHYDRVEINLTG